MRDTTHWYVRHDSTTRPHTTSTTKNLYVRHTSFICATWILHTFNMTLYETTHHQHYRKHNHHHDYARYTSFKCAKCLHKRPHTTSTTTHNDHRYYVQHASFMCATWLHKRPHTTSTTTHKMITATMCSIACLIDMCDMTPWKTTYHQHNRKHNYHH